jgi:Mn2+/Fe2+ NRAMP family transporter
MKRFLVLLLWSAITAAFIGPGTVTTAAKSGAGFGLSLLWALVFSTVACLALQEASARVTIATDQTLGEVIRTLFGRHRAVPALVLGSVVLGCAAYEMGNILGAVAGLELLLPVSSAGLTLVTGLLAGAVLSAGTARTVARILGILVAFMGVAFLTCAIQLKPAVMDVLKNCFVPAFPSGSGILVLGLVGTTVVPYNLFLGSGLARGQPLSETRLGLIVAIPLGGVISMSILVTGSVMTGEFTFAALAKTVADRLGGWAGTLFALGLFAAGLSSAITAPLAAALSCRGFMGRLGDTQWLDSTWRYRLVWISVLLFGLVFGLAGVPPIPAILLAQAFNGVMLPMVAVVLWISVNDRSLMGDRLLSGWGGNVWLGTCVLVTVLLGTAGVLRAITHVLGLGTPQEKILLAATAALLAAMGVPLLRRIRSSRT